MNQLLPDSAVAPPPFAAPDSIGLLISDCARLLRKRFDARARRIGVSRPGWRVLFVLARHEGTNQAALADRLEVETITVGRMIDRLADAGLVERRADPTDRRAWLLFLTPRAHPILAELQAIAAEVRAEMLAGFTDPEQLQLQTLLARTHANLSLREG